MRASEVIERLQNIRKEHITLRDVSNNKIAILARNRNIEALDYAISVIESILHDND